MTTLDDLDRLAADTFEGYLVKKDLAQQFESIFIQQMYKQMRKTVPDDGLLPRGNADEIYNQLQDLEAAKITAQQGGIGLAELMLEQLMKE